MYVVSEITGKRYSTVEECQVDEIRYNREKAEKERKRKEDQERLDKAWNGITKAIDNFISIAQEIDPNSCEDLKDVIQYLRLN